MSPLLSLIARSPFCLIPTGMVCAAVIAMAIWQHTERSLEEVRILRAVIKAFGWKDAEFAARIGLSEYQLSRVWGGDALNYHRLADLPVDFRAKWDAARVAIRGARVFEAEDLAFVRGAANLPRHQMLHMTEVAKVKVSA